MMLIISDDTKGKWGRVLKEAIASRGVQVEHFSSNTLDIKPCVACSSCSGKTYGQCIIPDDMQALYPKIVTCQALILISPVFFGGVSYHIKKVMDRMAAVGDPRYHIRDGELVKGQTGKGMTYFMIGVRNRLSQAESSAFLSLHGENRHIMNTQGRAFIVDSVDLQDSLKQIAQEILHE